MKTTWRHLSLTKGRRHFLFRYVEGCETEALASIVELAAREDSELDWYDAAVLSFQMGRSTRNGKNRPVAKKTNA